MTAATALRPTAAATQMERADDWRAAAMAMLSVRVIQGFIYWGGGSRRFIYAPAKIDPTQHHWMANKFQTAMPGALFGLDHVIGFMLQHFWLLYTGIIVFSAVELVFGLALMAGFLTRLSALVSVGLSIVLMLMFGWQGATCIDEWTMAACNLAMGATLCLAGSSAYSVDSLLLRRYPSLAGRRWFQWASGSSPLPLDQGSFRTLALGVLAFVIAFDVGTYNYYRGSVFSPYHEGPVSPNKHHFTISDAALTGNGGVRFTLYLDGGTPEAPAHVMKAELVGLDGATLARWDTEALTALPASAIKNEFAYNKFKGGPYGLTADMGARAVVSLSLKKGDSALQSASNLRLTDVNGRTFTGKVDRSKGV